MRAAEAVLLCLVACHFRAARAQIYDLGDLEIPANRSLHTLYAFYMFSYEEAPETGGQPYVQFENLVVKPKAEGDKALLKGYRSIQLSIMRYSDFWTLISPQAFCCAQANIDAGECHVADQLLVQKPPDQRGGLEFFSKTLGLHGRQERKHIIRTTGVYILVFSNCGDFTEATVSGRVVAKNAYGYLPGNEYHKMPFYGWLLVVYVVLGVIWAALSLRWFKELFNIQNCISAVIGFGLVESLLWYLFFNDWNVHGFRGRVLFILSILASVVKSIFSYMLVLVASLGWGVTRPYLDHDVVIKIQILSFLYIVLGFIREAVLSFRHSHSLSLAFVLLCLLPVSLLNGLIFFWVFHALSKVMDTLQERRQFEKLALFRRLWKLLIFALAIATFTLLFQIFTLSQSITTRWKYQWLFTDGITHILFLVVLAVMMYLWAPHKYSQRFAYSVQVDSGDPEPTTAYPTADVWGDDGADEDGDDGESFWATTHGDATTMDSAEAQGTAKKTSTKVEGMDAPDILGAAC